MRIEPAVATDEDGVEVAADPGQDLVQNLRGASNRSNALSTFMGRVGRHPGRASLPAELVVTPQEAYRCFVATNMDVLVLENFVLYKYEQAEAKRHDIDEYLAQFDLD